jgi:hypothetical protein
MQIYVYGQQLKWAAMESHHSCAARSEIVAIWGL